MKHAEQQRENIRCVYDLPGPAASRSVASDLI